MVPGLQERESRETPKLKAFCRVAPTVRLRARAIFAAGVFFLAIVFKSRTSVLVHSRRLDAFLAIIPPFNKRSPLARFLPARILICYYSTYIGTRKVAQL